MKLKRAKINELLKWRDAVGRKPLVLLGARQVGKTSVLKQFGEDHFEDFAYFNFEESPELKQFFKDTKDVSRIIPNLAIAHGRTIDPEHTLIILDEIQECRPALNALKYFNENAPEYTIIAAGSLLGLTLGQDSSFPVGKVDFMRMHPMSFEEFLENSNSKLWDAYNHYLESDKVENIPDLFFNPLMDLFKRYLISGGMPEAVNEFITTRSIEKTDIIIDNIIRSYKIDIAKHAGSTIALKINYILNSLPSQLAKEHKKFVYKTIKSGARAREYEEAILWLTQADFIIKPYNVSKPSLPLKAYVDLSAFKLYFNDVGLLRRLSGLDPHAYTERYRLFKEFKGALVENFVAQTFKQFLNHDLCYWTSKGKAELDFLLQWRDQVVPIEVKSDTNVQSKSLKVYQDKYEPRLRLRLSAKNLELNGNVLNVPVFMAQRVLELLDKADQMLNPKSSVVS